MATSFSVSTVLVLRLQQLIFFSLLASIAGCSLFHSAKNDPYAALNPPKIHVLDKDDQLNEPIKSQKSLIDTAEKSPFEKYYAALAAASSITATNVNPSSNVVSTGTIRNTDSQLIYNYLDAGIALVNSVCLRWFQSLANLQNKLDLASADTNIISELTTTLLGIGKANSIIVGTYGALNSTRISMDKNFSQFFLLAPNASKIKTRVFQGLDDYANRLRVNYMNYSFSQAYNGLEKYSDICTHEAAKELIDSSLINSETKSDANGNLTSYISATTLEKAKAEIAAETKAKDEAATKEKTRIETEAAAQKAALKIAEQQALAEKAKADAEKAKADAEKAKADAEKAKADAEKAKVE